MGILKRVAFVMGVIPSVTEKEREKILQRHESISNANVRGQEHQVSAELESKNLLSFIIKKKGEKKGRGECSQLAET